MRHYLSFFILFFAVVLTTWLTFHLGNAPSQPKKIEESALDAFATQVHLTNLDKTGHIQSEIASPQLLHFSEDNHTELRTPSLTYHTDNNPLVIDANSISFNPDTGVGVYKGNVIVTQGSSRLTADKVITLSDKENHLIELTAEGQPARYQTQPSPHKPPVKTAASIIKYHLKENLIEFIGQAYAEQGQDHMQGPHLRYHLKDHAFSSPENAEARTTIVLNPRSSV